MYRVNVELKGISRMCQKYFPVYPNVYQDYPEKCSNGLHALVTNYLIACMHRLYACCRTLHTKKLSKES